MRNRLLTLISLLLVLCLCAGCDRGAQEPASTGHETTVKDYAVAVQPDKTGSVLQQEVTVKLYIDGDTVHFHVPVSEQFPTGVLKARFLGVNTPESTGKIEEYGKTAAAFTKEKLMAAETILIESDTANWDADSTGGRYLVWIWYKSAGSETWRNLNIELLQEGLAIASSSANNRYGSICTAAIDQAKANGMNIYSGQPDPNFFYGSAIELDLKELRTNVEAYNGQKVAFTGVITMNYNNGVYVEQYDPETDMYYGMYAYYGFGFGGMKLLKVGNEVRIVGSVSEFNGTWQVSGLTYSDFIPTADDVQLISQGNERTFRLTDPTTFVNGSVEITFVDPDTDAVSTATYPYAQLVMGTSISMEGLYVKDVYTTESDNDSSDGAMTLTCEKDGVTVSVRTVVLTDASGNRITAEAYEGKTIDVKGVVDCFNGTYQIKILSADYITVK